MFFILCDVIFLVRLQENFVIDHFGSERVYECCCTTLSAVSAAQAKSAGHLDSRIFVVFQSNFQAMRTLLPIFALVILVHSARGECRDGNWWDIHVQIKSFCCSLDYIRDVIPRNQFFFVRSCRHVQIKSFDSCLVAGHVPTLPWVRSRVWVRVRRVRASFRERVGRDVARKQASSTSVVFQSNSQATMRTFLSFFALVILVHSARGECRDGNWWDILNNDNVWATCNANEYITGLWRSETGGFGLHGDDGLNRIEWPNAAVHLKEMQMLTAWMLTGGTPSTGIHVFFSC